MSDKMRWRYNDTNPVAASVDSATVIEIGDLVWQDIDNIKPASMVNDMCLSKEAGQTIVGTAEDLQRFFVARFIGVAMQRSRLGDTDTVRVSTTGLFEFECPPCCHELGDLFGPTANDAGKLQNQAVAMVSEPRLAIGRCAKRSAGGQGHEVFVEVRSVVMTGGVLCSAPTP